MGTNFYLKAIPGEHSGKSEDPIHIGKSSAGWCFSLHVIPNKDINDLEDWEREWKKPKVFIEDEYGTRITDTEMRGIIINRRQVAEYELPPIWYAKNHAVRGPNGLARCKIDGRHCVGHGNGTYDFITGEFE